MKTFSFCRHLYAEGILADLADFFLAEDLQQTARADQRQGGVSVYCRPAVDDRDVLERGHRSEPKLGPKLDRNQYCLGLL